MATEITPFTGNALAGRHTFILPRVIQDAGEDASRRFLEFFTADIRNPNTRPPGICPCHKGLLPLVRKAQVVSAST